MTAFYFLWASRTGHGIHTGMPSVEQAEADGYEMVGGDPRYPDSVLMRKPVEVEDVEITRKLWGERRNAISI
ncbi:MAG TPA: hypothetical protein DCP69_10480 [Candidatus Omnitrophica bacterium]|nr:hypothetical protein [Candidatus Omnitrophota bacterium]